MHAGMPFSGASLLQNRLGDPPSASGMGQTHEHSQDIPRYRAIFMFDRSFMSHPCHMQTPESVTDLTS